MADDLGDSHVASLQQGGKLPSNSQECRVVGKVFPKANSTISVELYPLFSTLSINLLLVDSNCNVIDSISGIGNILHDFNVADESWYTIKIRNTTPNQMGQKCWVKLTYEAPTSPNLNTTKNKCACSSTTSVNFEDHTIDYYVYPNPANDFIQILNNENIYGKDYEILDISGRIIQSGKLSLNYKVDVTSLKVGSYYLNVGNHLTKFIKTGW